MKRKGFSFINIFGLAVGDVYKRQDMHTGVLLPLQSGRVGEHKIVYLAVAQQVLLLSLIHI